MRAQESQVAEDARRLARYNRAVQLLRETQFAFLNLHALVAGECPSILEDDHHDDMVHGSISNIATFLAEEPTK